MVKYLRPLLLILIIIVIALFYKKGGNEYLNFELIQSHLKTIQLFYKNHPWQLRLIFFSSIVLLTSLSIPGSIVLTVLAGSIFGAFTGTLIVCLATAIGASIAFLMARFLFQDIVAKKFYKKVQIMNRKVREEGAYYLLILRLVPVTPFIVINLVMGLTAMKVFTFAWISFIGMFPGTFIYVYAGRKMAEINNAREIMSWPIILSLIALSILPYVFKTIIERRKEWKA